jgi:hypothetical protein
LISNTSGSTTPFGIGYSADSFAFGDAGIGLGSPIQDYTFSQFVIVTTAPVPESNTVAALIAAALVAGLVGFRLRQRRQQQLALAPVVAS